MENWKKCIKMQWSSLFVASFSQNMTTTDGWFLTPGTRRGNFQGCKATGHSKTWDPTVIWVRQHSSATKHTNSREDRIIKWHQNNLLSCNIWIYMILYDFKRIYIYKEKFWLLYCIYISVHKVRIHCTESNEIIGSPWTAWRNGQKIKGAEWIKHVEWKQKSKVFFVSKS